MENSTHLVVDITLWNNLKHQFLSESNDVFDKTIFELCKNISVENIYIEFPKCLTEDEISIIRSRDQWNMVHITEIINGYLRLYTTKTNVEYISGVTKHGNSIWYTESSFDTADEV